MMVVSLRFLKGSGAASFESRHQTALGLGTPIAHPTHSKPGACGQ